MKKVLIMEDEASIRNFVVINLQRVGHEVVEAATGDQALEILQQNPDISVAILDITVPGIDGFEVCRWIRAAERPIGVIMLTSRTQEMDKVTGLMTGVDEYLAKPFSPAELTAKVNVLFNRLKKEEEAEETLSDGPLLLNIHNHCLDKNGVRIRLTQPEFEILKLFMSNSGKVFSREEIKDMIWTEKQEKDLAIVDINIRRLRIKIEEDAANPKYINTVWGCGYKWKN